MKLIFIFLLIICNFCKAQVSYNQPSLTIPFELTCYDTRGNQTGKIKYNHNTNRLMISGNIKPALNWFTLKYLIPNFEVFEAQQKVIEQMDWNGGIRNIDSFKNAIGEYRRLKIKYGM